MSNCIVVFITVEKQDLNLENLSINLSNEILKFVKETKSCSVAICPFAHLSNSLADSENSIKFFDLLEKLINKKIPMVRMHFGSDKSLMMKVFGHKGNVRFREF